MAQGGTIRHEIFRGDGIKAATIVVDGAWIDLVKTQNWPCLPQEFITLFMNSPKSEDYIEETCQNKNKTKWNSKINLKQAVADSKTIAITT